MAETTKARGWGCDRSLAETKEFRVAIGNLLCRDREILCCEIVGKAGTIFCHDRVSHARGFLSGHNVSMS